MAQHFESSLRTLFGQLVHQRRWRNFEASPRESIAEHMFKQNLITQLMIEMELHAENPHGIDPYRILACSNTHDYGEGPIGDVPLSEKTAYDDDREAAAFETLMDQLIPTELRKCFPQPLDRSAPVGDINREFWKACEQVGYLVYASYAVRTNAKFQPVIDTHLPELRQSKFTSVLWMLRRIGLNND